MRIDYLDIVTIIPALPGWEAIYAQGRRDEGRFDIRPLAGWALVNVVPNAMYPTNQVVVGLVVAELNSHVLDFVDQVEKFVGYNYPGCTTDWTKEVQQNKVIRPEKERPQPYKLIKSLIPSQPGWEAVYVTSRKLRTIEFIPVIGWVVVEFGNTASTIVVGLVLGSLPRFDLEFVDQAGKFLGYNSPGCVIAWSEII